MLVGCGPIHAIRLRTKVVQRRELTCRSDFENCAAVSVRIAQLVTVRSPAVCGPVEVSAGGEHDARWGGVSAAHRGPAKTVESCEVTL